MSVTTMPVRTLVHRQPGWLARLFDYKPFLIVVCLTPAIGLLTVFLTYPLGLGIWLAFTDTTVGRSVVVVGLQHVQYLLTEPRWWGTVFYSVFYAAVATFGKFALGFWLALLLNNHFPFKSLLRAIVLLPWIVPTVLSALAFWWIYDPQFSIISYLLVDVLHVRSTNIDFLGSPWPARFSLIAANIWRGIPFVAISLLAGLQTISPSLYEAAMLDGATAWQRFRYITFPMMLPILAIVMTFSIIFTFTDFQLVYAITRGGPVNSTHLLATLAFQRGIAGGELGEGAAIAVSMIPFLVLATLFSYFGLDHPAAVGEHAGRVCDRAAALSGQSLCGLGDLSRLSGAAVDPVHSAGDRRGPVRPVRQSLGADPGLPDLPGAVLHLAPDRLFQ